MEASDGRPSAALVQELEVLDASDGRPSAVLVQAPGSAAASSDAVADIARPAGEDVVPPEDRNWAEQWGPFRITLKKGQGFHAVCRYHRLQLSDRL